MTQTVLVRRAEGPQIREDSQRGRRCRRAGGMGISAVIATVALAALPAARCESGFDTASGHGNLGTWTNDEFGLPAYRYTGCPFGLSGCAEPADVFHQLGNGGSTAIAHSRGDVELFSNRTFPRFANHYDDKKQNFAGGFGWVRDGATAWSTLYDDRPWGASYDRVFGMGYFRKTIANGGLTIQQTLYMTPGVDALIHEDIVFTNETPLEKEVQYFDYWDVAWWLLNRSGFSSTSQYDPATVATAFDSARATVKAVSQLPEGDGNIPDLAHDPEPKVAFVSVLEGQLEGFDTVQKAFFGDGNRQLPAAVRAGHLGGTLVGAETGGKSPETSTPLANEDATLVTSQRFVLPPGGRHSTRLIYGLARRGDENALIDAQKAKTAPGLAETMHDWKERIPRLDLPTDPWLGREMAWSTYYLSSGLLREDYFDTRVLNQASIYLYDWGTNAGPRASLRHLLPLIYIDPAAAKDNLIYFLRAMKPTGELCYATGGHGAWNSLGLTPSDATLWLIPAVAEYVNATRDYAFLDEHFSFWCEMGRGACGSATAYEMVQRAYAYQRTTVGTGSHGLVRLLNSDWDDSLTSLSPKVDPARTFALGESTMNTAMALFAYPKLAELATRRGDARLAGDALDATAKLTEALRAQWRDDHFNRAYIVSPAGDGVEVGDNNVWIASNGPALMAPGLMTGTQVAALVGRMKKDNSDPSPVGLASEGAPLTSGIGTPGFWYSLTGLTIEGLLDHPETPSAKELAWTEFRKATLTNHAETYPNIWYGTWSGPDMYITPIEGIFDKTQTVGGTYCYPGLYCMTDFPVTNMFSHSEPLLASIRMAGVRVTTRGHTIDPGYPADTFEWASQTYSVRYAPDRAAGHLVGKGDDVLEMRVRLPRTLAPGDAVVHVNGASVATTAQSGMAVFMVPVRAGVATTWAVTKR